jgi:hypothetical protein
MSNIPQDTLVPTTIPVIAGVEITTDSEERFNLNALHKASGLGKHKAPNKWLETKQSQELILALKSQTPNSGSEMKSSGYEPINVINGGTFPGTYAHELLAVSYAGWISPAFQLTVNQTFLDYRTGKLQPAQHISDPTIAALVHTLVEIDQIKQRQVVQDQKNQQLEARLDAVELQHQNGVPVGHISRKQAHHLYAVGLGEEIFHLAMAAMKVPTKPYIHSGESGYDVPTNAYLESEIQAAIAGFLANAQQVSAKTCESPMLNGRRFRYVKENTKTT